MKKKKKQALFDSSGHDRRPHYAGVKNPLRDVLQVLCAGQTPPDFVRGYDYSKFTDEQHHELQDWVGTHLHPDIDWSTAIGVVDAALAITEEAESNGNISQEWEKGQDDGKEGDRVQRGEPRHARKKRA